MLHSITYYTSFIKHYLTFKFHMVEGCTRLCDFICPPMTEVQPSMTRFSGIALIFIMMCTYIIPNLTEIGPEMCKVRIDFFLNLLVMGGFPCTDFHETHIHSKYSGHLWRIYPKQKKNVERTKQLYWQPQIKHSFHSADRYGTVTHWYKVEIFYTKFHPHRSGNMENMDGS